MRTTSYRPSVVHYVMRASRLCANEVHVEMRQGLNTLASIAVTAPMVGSIGTIFGIVIDSFRVSLSNKEDAFMQLRMNVANALLPLAAGVLLGLVSHWVYKYFNGKVEEFDRQMNDATLELANRLSRLHISN